VRPEPHVLYREPNDVNRLLAALTPTPSLLWRWLKDQLEVYVLTLRFELPIVIGLGPLICCASSRPPAETPVKPAGIGSTGR
jgi:hypothetical protein